MKKELYLVFRYLETGIHEFCGVYDDETVAVKTCIYPNMCVCPAVLNETIDALGTKAWPRAWYPMLESKPVNGIAKETEI